MVIVTNQALRFDIMNMSVNLIKFPIKRSCVAVMIPDSIKPDGAHIAVTGKKLRKLILHELHICRIILLGLILSCLEACSACRIIIPGPVNQRVVQMEINALFGAGLRQFRNHIPLEWRRINDVVVGHLGVVHRESVVMTRGKANVFCS